MDKYLQALKEKICSICVDSDEKGNCKMTNDECCAIEVFIDKIVNVVLSIESENINDYVNALHQKICIECRGQAEHCKLREDVNCSLDRYFPLIVEIIRETSKSVA